jgi:hypothetical protein
MDYDKIYSILSSKEHNPHFLKRYINFMKQCFGQTHAENTYTEKHHICPKAKTLFPEYANLSIHKWNSIILTPRQHFIAHWILWKCYGGSQYRSFWMMLHAAKTEAHKERYKCVNSKLFAKLKEEHSFHTKGEKNYFHKNKFVGKDNGFYGKTHSQETRERWSKQRKGKKLSEETRLKQSIAHKGKKHTQSQIEHFKSLKWFYDPINNKNTKAVECPLGFLPGRIYCRKNLK